MVTPELKCPTTNLTPSPTNLLATDTPSFGSARSSPTLSTIFWPRMPPAALMSSTACSTPCFSCAPKAALPPVIGPATPSFTSAAAVLAAARLAATAKAGQSIRLMQDLPSRVRTQSPTAGEPAGEQEYSTKVVTCHVDLSARKLGSRAGTGQALRRHLNGPARSNSQPYWPAICPARTIR